MLALVVRAILHTYSVKEIEMADRDGIASAHAVQRRNTKTHLRTNPDGKSSNNFDDMTSK